MVWFWDISLRGFAPQLRLRRQRLRVEPSKTLSLFDGGRGNYFTHIVRAWTFVLSTLDAFIAAPVWSGVRCAIYSTIFTSLLRLDREALPLELSASLLARGLTARFVSLAYLPSYVIFLPTIMN